MGTPIKLLVVEDDPNLGMLLAEYLRAKGFQVDLRSDGLQGWDAYSDGGYDLLVLDVMMPLKDGFSLARDVRRKDETTPIIFLTAKSMKEDTLLGFESGGDDYLTKPFSMEELILRINAVIKRTRGPVKQEEPLARHDLGKCVFDARRQLLEWPGGERRLTTKESELLRLLCDHRDRVLERSMALKSIWGDDSYFNGRSMDVYIAKLRKYLKVDPEVEIMNVHGKGFRLVVHAAQ